MEPNNTVTLAGIIAVFIVGCINIAISIHRNNLDGVTQNRMNWITEVREIASKIISEDYGREFEKDVIKFRLYLNGAKDRDLDHKILSLCEELSELKYKQNFEREEHESYLADGYEFELAPKAQELAKCIQIYLKMEWTRVKCENSMTKIRYLNCWDPIHGFREKDALKMIFKQYVG